MKKNMFQDSNPIEFGKSSIQGGSNMTGTDLGKQAALRSSYPGHI
jgi:hypothetical protein